MVAAKTLSNSQRTLLARLAGRIIPASAEYGVPGADDDAVVETILSKAQRYGLAIPDGLDQFVAFAESRPGKIEEWEVADLSAALDAFEAAAGGGFVGLLTMLTAQAYYQDPRVLESLDLEPRPPFPKGQEVPQGDWSLLEPVKERGKRYRDA